MLAAKKDFEEIDTAVNTQHWVCLSQKKTGRWKLRRPLQQ